MLDPLGSQEPSPPILFLLPPFPEPLSYHIECPGTHALGWFSIQSFLERDGNRGLSSRFDPPFVLFLPVCFFQQYVYRSLASFETEEPIDSPHMISPSSRLYVFLLDSPPRKIDRSAPDQPPS